MDNSSDKAILVCACMDMPSYAQDAFSQLFPDEINPILYQGKSDITEFANSFPRESECYEKMHAIARLKTKFAYLFEYDSNGGIISITNLRTGAEIE